MLFAGRASRLVKRDCQNTAGLCTPQRAVLVWHARFETLVAVQQATLGGIGSVRASTRGLTSAVDLMRLPHSHKEASS